MCSSSNTASAKICGALLGKIVPNTRDNPMLSLTCETVGLSFGWLGWIDAIVGTVKRDGWHTNFRLRG